MSVRSCRVTIRDTEGIEPSAEVTAESLFEAVALGIRAIRQCTWAEDIGQNFTIRVLARDIHVSSTQWRSANSTNAHVREILGDYMTK